VTFTFGGLLTFVTDEAPERIISSFENVHENVLVEKPCTY
jgi:hypothetical protein